MIIYFDQLLHRKMDKFNTFTLRGKVYAWLHNRVHDVAFLLSPDRAELSGKKVAAK